MQSASDARGLRRLDFTAPPVAIGGGVTIGVVVALVALVGLPAWGGVGVVLGGLVGAYALAASGRAIAKRVGVEAQPAAEPDSLERAIALERELGPHAVFVDIPAGTFLMGSEWHEALDREKPVHSVSLTEFACMRVVVTRRLYAAVMGRPDVDESEADLPQVDVSWLDAIEFCNEWSRRAELEPCYLREGDVVTWNAQANGYRLPTEAEWEYAARAGTTTNWCCGDDESALGEYAWYGEVFKGEAHEVGQKKPNPWGLFDMHGNVWEWVWDVFGPYSEDEQTNPIGPKGGSKGEQRVLRGGAFGSAPRDLRSSFRGGNRPSYQFRYIGFRCIRGSGRQH